MAEKVSMCRSNVRVCFLCSSTDRNKFLPLLQHSKYNSGIILESGKDYIVVLYIIYLPLVNFEVSTITKLVNI